MSADLHVLPSEPLGLGLIETLEQALELAKSGELSSVAVVMVYRDGCTSHIRSHLPSYSTMLGAASRLVHRLNMDMDDNL